MPVRERKGRLPILKRDVVTSGPEEVAEGPETPHENQTAPAGVQGRRVIQGGTQPPANHM